MVYKRLKMAQPKLGYPKYKGDITNMKPKILIGCPTYDGQEYCLKEFVRGLNDLSYDNFDVLFVDNSKNTEYVKKLKNVAIDGHKVTVLHDVNKDTRIDNIISSRNVVREFFFNNKEYTHLLFIDTDIVPPPQVIEELLKLDTDIASGVYLCRTHINGKNYVIPTLYLAHSDGSVKTMRRQDVGSEPFDIAVCGMGCCLIARRVFDHLKFRPFNDSKTGGEDVAFCYDAQKMAYRLRAHGSMKCKHIGKNETLEFGN